MRFRTLSPFTIGLVALIALAASVLIPSASDRVPAASAAGDCTVDATLDADEVAFLGLINAYRAQNGLGALKASYTLSKASAWKSKDMAANSYFAHDDLSRTWVDRVRDCGYGFNAYIGENIAAGYGTAQSVFDGWKASPGHNANMLGANYTSIGIGKYVQAGSQWGTYWTTDFGSFSDGWVTITGDGISPLAPPVAPTPVASITPTASRTRVTSPTAIATPTRIATPRIVATPTVTARADKPSPSPARPNVRWSWWRFFH